MQFRVRPTAAPNPHSLSYAGGRSYTECALVVCAVCASVVCDVCPMVACTLEEESGSSVLLASVSSRREDMLVMATRVTEYTPSPMYVGN